MKGLLIVVREIVVGVCTVPYDNEKIDRLMIDGPKLREALGADAPQGPKAQLNWLTTELVFDIVDPDSNRVTHHGVRLRRIATSMAMPDGSKIVADRCFAVF